MTTERPFSNQTCIPLRSGWVLANFTLTFIISVNLPQHLRLSACLYNFIWVYILNSVATEALLITPHIADTYTFSTEWRPVEDKCNTQTKLSSSTITIRFIFSIAGTQQIQCGRYIDAHQLQWVKVIIWKVLLGSNINSQRKTPVSLVKMFNDFK